MTGRLEALHVPGYREVPNDPDPPLECESPPPPSIVAQVYAEHPDLDEAAIWAMARDVASGVAVERRRRLVRRIADDGEASQAMTLDRAHVVTADQFLREQTTPAAPCLGGLVSEGHNAVLAAQYKTGKSTLIENACQALVSAQPFLGIFAVRRPYRVALLNYEMTPDDCRARIKSLGMVDEELERLLVVNLRGVGLSFTAPNGRTWLVDQLKRHRAEVAIIDTYGAASAPSVESENDNAGSRRFLMAWDAIKAQTSVHTSIITHHTGRAVQVEGEEHARGATVIDDWADVRIILTRDRESGNRFLSSEGRSTFNLPESRLFFEEPTRRLWLPEANLGENRRQTKEVRDARTVADIVVKQPGIITTRLREALDTTVSHKAGQAAAIEAAKRRGLIHTHKAAKGVTVHHYPGAIHADSDRCPDPNYTTEAP